MRIDPPPSVQPALVCEFDGGGRTYWGGECRETAMAGAGVALAFKVLTAWLCETRE